MQHNGKRREGRRRGWRSLGRHHRQGCTNVVSGGHHATERERGGGEQTRRDGSHFGRWGGRVELRCKQSLKNVWKVHESLENLRKNRKSLVGMKLEKHLSVHVEEKF